MWRYLTNFVFSMFLLGSCGISFGQVTISIDDILIAPSGSLQTGSFEVYLAHDEVANPNLAGFQLLLTLFDGVSPATSARFTSVQAPLSRPYAFAPNSLSPVSNISNGGSTAEVGDFLLSGQAEVADGDAFALISFEIDAGSQLGDEFQIQISTDTDETFLATSGTGRLPFSTSNGRILVSAVPESSVLIPLSLLGLGATIRRRASSSR